MVQCYLNHIGKTPNTSTCSPIHAVKLNISTEHYWTVEFEVKCRVNTEKGGVLVEIMSPAEESSFICKGPKYRFTLEINFKSRREKIAGTPQEFCNRWCK